MKKLIPLFLLFSVFMSCQKPAVDKPDKLISEDNMVDIIYDLSLLESIKSQYPKSLEVNNINPNEYVYKKYKIDSLQFAKNDQYYASDIKKYKKIYDKVSKRLQDKINIPDTSNKTKSDSDQPAVR